MLNNLRFFRPRNYKEYFEQCIELLLLLKIYTYVKLSPAHPCISHVVQVPHHNKKVFVLRKALRVTGQGTVCYEGSPKIVKFVLSNSI